MAYLDDDEIIATIRHEMRLEDEDGRCNDVLPPVFRRAKNGGLPLDFRSLKRTDEDDEDGRQSPGYTIPIEEEVSSTKELITTRLRSRTTDSGKLAEELEALQKNAMCSLEADRVLYVERPATEIEQRLRARQQAGPSALSRALDDTDVAATAAGPEAAFRAFAVHDAGEHGAPSSSKRIMIVYAIPEAEGEGGEVTTITISVKSNATVADLVGLACYKFAEKTGIAPSAPLETLQLYIAEESGEIDDEFPPMESHKMIAEFGFPVLALRAGDNGASQRGGSSSTRGGSSLCALIYLPGKEGVRYTIDLQSTQQTLRWLRDEAVKMKIEETANQQSRTFTQMATYNLELLEKPEALDLDKTIASTGTNEFVLIRKNSSRGDWHPRGSSNASAATVGDYALQPPPTPSGPMGGMGFDFNVNVNVSASLRTPNMGTEESAIAVFTVDRLHKYKNKWPAHLVLRWNWIEVTPVPTERRLSNRFQGGGQKSNMIAWEDLADARMREKRNPGGGLPIVQLSITWLPAPGVAQTPTTPLRKTSMMLFETSPPSSAPLTMGGATQTLQDISSRYKDADKWKVLNLEMNSYAEGDRAVRLLNDGIKQRNSAVSQAFLHSSNGEIRPGAAADSALSFQRTLREARPAPVKAERKRSSIAQFTSGIGRMFTNRD
ncbi:hypothetical protein PMAYCL1PPCAC_08404 [Pristionchus mayeri]|uniref:Sinh-1 n=1 Tax=Pristionchus mayeri TaxID=1317129 RepID=A0AAN5CD36_9BILA|nr:hypothetical protein PMAYCL1PPCAC_08404 [Pristionchus mayeri]